MMGSRRQGLWVVGLVAGLATVGFAHWRERRPSVPDSTPRELAAIARDAGLTALADARLSTLPLVGWEPKAGGAMAAPSQARNALRALTVHAERDSSPSSLRLRATLSLLGSKASTAVKKLEEALATEPDQGATLSDLSAAFAARATEEDRSFDLVKSLSAAKRAVDQSPDLPQARFQFAEALSRFSLRYQAIPAWEAYLDLIPAGSDPYAESRLAKLREPTALELWPKQKVELVEAALDGDKARAAEIVRKHPSGALEEAETTLLGAWANAALERNQTEAEHQLAGTRVIAEILAEENGDFLLLDEVELIERSRGDERRLRLLAKGHQGYADGVVLVLQQEFASSLQLFRSASRSLSEAGSRSALRSAYQTSFATFYVPDYEAASAQLQSILSRVAPAREAMLGAQVYRLLALVERQRARFADSLKLYQEARRLAALADDAESVTELGRLMAGTLFELGQQEAAWKEVGKALNGVTSLRTHRFLISFLGRIGDAMQRQREPWAAVTFHSEAVALAGQFGSPLEKLVARRSRSQALAGVGAIGRAKSDLAAAWLAWESIRDARVRESAKAEVLRAESDLPLDSDLGARLGRESAALDFFRTTNKATYLPQAFAARARVHVALGNDAAAEVDLRMGIAELERQQAALPNGSLRVSHLALPPRIGLFDSLVELQALAQGRPDEAFSTTEAARGRSLLDRLTQLQPRNIGAEAPVTIQHIQQALSVSTTLIYFAVLPRNVLVWRIQHDSTRHHVLDLPERELAGLVRSLQSALDRDHTDPVFQVAAGELFDRTLQPVLADWSSTPGLVLIPDGPLLGVPFAALLDRSRNSLLVERAAITVAPSARVFLRASAHQRSFGAEAPRRILAIGVNHADTAVFPDLAPLSAAESEAQRLAALYPSSQVLVGLDATPARVAALAKQAEVVHFAGHSVVSEERPELSSLALSGSSAGHGAWFAHDIANLSLSKTRLVVLSSCDSAAGPNVRGEGALSLSRAFLTTGVPTVVASLWEVDDASGQQIFERLHGKVARGQDAAAAVRETQLEMLRSGEGLLRKPNSWASITVAGAQ